MQCASGRTDVVHIVEIDMQSKQARLWARFGSSVTNGPFGPFAVAVTPQKVTWVEKTATGRAASKTTYTFDRSTQKLTIHIDYNAFMDQDPWTEVSSCKSNP